MVLSFKNQFIDKILSGEKKHTIRKDSPNRWKAGVLIHFATGVRTKEYQVFKMGYCTETQRIEIANKKGYPKAVWVDGYKLSEKQIEILAKNDGFDSVYDFFKWFNDDFQGKIIHWHSLHYDIS